MVNRAAQASECFLARFIELRTVIPEKDVRVPIQGVQRHPQVVSHSLHEKLQIRCPLFKPAQKVRGRAHWTILRE
jgi:predicted phage tail protein